MNGSKRDRLFKLMWSLVMCVRERCGFFLLLSMLFLFIYFWLFLLLTKQ